MLAQLKTFTMVGLDAHHVDVEVDTIFDPNTPNPNPSITTVGLPDKAVRESSQRVKRAIANAGFRLQYDHITINLAPVELRKHAAKAKFGTEPSSSVICRALGAYRTRLNTAEPLILAKAKDLLVACTMDTALAASMLHRAMRAA